MHVSIVFVLFEIMGLQMFTVLRIRHWGFNIMCFIPAPRQTNPVALYRTVFEKATTEQGMTIVNEICKKERPLTKTRTRHTAVASIYSPNIKMQHFRKRNKWPFHQACFVK